MEKRDFTTKDTKDTKVSETLVVRNFVFFVSFVVKISSH